MGVALAMLVVDFVVYSTLGWYLDQVPVSR
jgi:hypothetical protein